MCDILVAIVDKKKRMYREIGRMSVKNNPNSLPTKNGKVNRLETWYHNQVEWAELRKTAARVRTLMK